MVELNQKYSKDPSIVSREIAGEMILVPIRQNVGDMEKIYTLNQSAALAWKLMDGKHSIEEIRDSIVSTYDVTEEQAGEDLLELVEKLTEIGAVRKE